MKKTPEDYGYKIGENIAPYINKCIAENGECYISEGEHILGRNDKNWHLGHVWSDSSIVWGWNRFNDIKIIGAGPDKTILKWIDNCNYNYLFDKPSDVMVMVSTNWNESCNNNVIDGITFDGNYSNNQGNATLIGIRINGENNTIKNCKFINFGVGSNNKHECFNIVVGPQNKSGKGTQIINNYFTSPGRKTGSPNIHIPENTFVAVGGYETLIKGNTFENIDFNINNQQSPIHGVSIAFSTKAKIVENKFLNFQGACVYMDSWTNEDFTIENNIAKNVWQFLQLTCQKWDNPSQISFNKNGLITNNEIELSQGNCFYHWNQPPIVSNFCGYVHAPDIDTEKYPGFENIIITKNKVILGYRQLRDPYFEESTKLICYWGTPAPENKIKMIDNNFQTTIPILNKSWFQKIVDFFKKLFKI